MSVLYFVTISPTYLYVKVHIHIQTHMHVYIKHIYFFYLLPPYQRTQDAMTLYYSDYVLFLNPFISAGGYQTSLQVLPPLPPGKRLVYSLVMCWIVVTC